jgi:hypothetical protein
MAAVTQNSIEHVVQGNKRVILANVDIAADEDTFVTGLRVINHFTATSVTNNAIGGTSSAGTITFQTAGAEAGVTVRAEGY